MDVPIHPTVEYRMNLTGILKGERWREQLSDPTSSQYSTLSQHFSEKVTCTPTHKHIHSCYCTVYTIRVHMHLWIHMSCLQVSNALRKLNELKSVTVLDFRCVGLDFFFKGKNCMNSYLWRYFMYTVYLYTSIHHACVFLQASVGYFWVSPI